MDHVGIVALILGTPVTAVMAHTHGGMPLDLKVRTALADQLAGRRTPDRARPTGGWRSQVTCAVMVAAAFLPPTLRVLGFTAGIVTMLGMHASVVLDWNLGVQLALYLVGAFAFLRCVRPPPPLLPRLLRRALRYAAVSTGTAGTSGGRGWQTTTCCTTLSRWLPQCTSSTSEARCTACSIEQESQRPASVSARMPCDALTGLACVGGWVWDLSVATATLSSGSQLGGAIF